LAPDFTPASRYPSRGRSRTACSRPPNERPGRPRPGQATAPGQHSAGLHRRSMTTCGLLRCGRWVAVCCSWCGCGRGHPQRTRRVPRLQ
jgi:hypothetical protein